MVEDDALPLNRENVSSYVIPLDKVSLKFLLKAMLIVGSGGLIFGYDIAVIAGALGSMKDEFNLDSVQQGLVVSFIYIGSVFGSIWGGPLVDKIGRWKTIHVQNLIFIAGAIIISFAVNVTYLYIGRLLVGIAAALSGIAEVAYLLEISPSELRGPITTAYEIAVCIGVLLSFILGLALDSVQDGWRILFAVPAGMAVLQSIGMMHLPESPQWLSTTKHDIATADISLATICDNRCNHQYKWLDRVLQFAISGSKDASEVETANVLLSGAYIHVAQLSDTKDSAANSNCTTDQPVKVICKYQYPMWLIVWLQVLIQFSGGSYHHTSACEHFELEFVVYFFCRSCNT
jgi:MFS family permease